MESLPNARLRVVVLGGSAGSIEAFATVLSALPAQPNLWCACKRCDTACCRPPPT